MQFHEVEMTSGEKLLAVGRSYKRLPVFKIQIVARVALWNRGGGGGNIVDESPNEILFPTAERFQLFV